MPFHILTIFSILYLWALFFLLPSSSLSALTSFRFGWYFLSSILRLSFSVILFVFFLLLLFIRCCYIRFSHFDGEWEILPSFNLSFVREILWNACAWITFSRNCFTVWLSININNTLFLLSFRSPFFSFHSRTFSLFSEKIFAYRNLMVFSMCVC